MRDQNKALAELATATRMLASIRTPADAKKVVDFADLARRYARKTKLGHEAMNHAAEVKLRAERAGGELLVQMEKQHGARTKRSNGVLPRLDDLGIDKMQSSRWQAIAGVPCDTFESYLVATQAQGGELHESDVLKLARGAELRPLMTSGSPDWNTPQEIVARVIRALGAIDLDPCSNTGKPNVPAAKHYTEREDGLSHDWRGRVYMNPPYGRDIGQWVQKLVSEHKAGRAAECVALVPARTDTEWWSLMRDALVCFIGGRLRFSEADAGAPFPSAVLYLGSDRRAFARAFVDVGDLWSRFEA